MSERREQRRVERCAGTGTVTRDGVAVGSVSYVMEIWQTFHIIRTFGPGPEQEVEGLKEISITFIRHQLDTFRLWHERATLTLHLQDGRRLDGFLNGDSFVASGQLTAA
jgi:hypothetical protein